MLMSSKSIHSLIFFKEIHFFFQRNTNIIIQLIESILKTQIAKAILRIKNEVEGITIPHFKMSCSSQNSMMFTLKTDTQINGPEWRALCMYG